jgi:uncharacterized protein (DUF1330 family)
MTMRAFFVATVTIRHPEKFQEYAQKASATFARHGGQAVLRGKVDGALAGGVDHQALGIVGFPDADALSAWFNSPEYQALVPLRDEAADITIITYSTAA